MDSLQASHERVLEQLRRQKELTLRMQMEVDDLNKELERRLSTFRFIAEAQEARRGERVK